jgi:hypothetical protein
MKMNMTFIIIVEVSFSVNILPNLRAGTVQVSRQESKRDSWQDDYSRQQRPEDAKCLQGAKNNSRRDQLLTGKQVRPARKEAGVDNKELVGFMLHTEICSVMYFL